MENPLKDGNLSLNFIRYVLLCCKCRSTLWEYFPVSIHSLMLFISEHRYHIPRSFFKPSGNTLIIFEERGGDPTKITFAKRHETMICSFISEDHPQLDLENWDVNGKDNAVGALMNLKCPEGTSISSIIFASFGNPSGTCSSYRQGSCHYSNSISVIEKVNFRF